MSIKLLFVAVCSMMFAFAVFIGFRKASRQTRKPLKSGTHHDGRPYLDFTDPYTANSIRDATEKYRNIKVEK